MRGDVRGVSGNKIEEPPNNRQVTDPAQFSGIKDLTHFTYPVDCAWPLLGKKGMIGNPSNMMMELIWNANPSPNRSPNAPIIKTAPERNKKLTAK